MVLVAGMVPLPGEKGEDWCGEHRLRVGRSRPGRGLRQRARRLLPRRPAGAGGRGSEPTRAIRRKPRGWSRGRSTRGPTPRRSTCSAATTACFPAEWMRGVVRERLGIAPDEIDGGHCPALSRPQELCRAPGGVPDGTPLYRLLTEPCPAPSRRLGRPLATRARFLSRRSNPTGRSTMRRTLTLILGVALFGILAAVVVASQGADDPADASTETSDRRPSSARPRWRTTPTPAPTTTPTGGVDISGPCDEAEHANDPRCGGQAPAQQGTTHAGARPGRRGHLRPV